MNKMISQAKFSSLSESGPYARSKPASFLTKTLSLSLLSKKSLFDRYYAKKAKKEDNRVFLSPSLLFKPIQQKNDSSYFLS